MAMTLQEKLSQLLTDYIPDERDRVHVVAIACELMKEEKKKLIERIDKSIPGMETIRNDALIVKADLNELLDELKEKL